MLRILHIDDSRNYLELTKLQIQGHADDLQVEWADSATHALEMLKTEEYDCILSDYLMQEMDGLELLKAVRHRSIDTPFIFLTGQGSEKIAAEALRFGADDYFTKEAGVAHYERLIGSIYRVVEAYEKGVKSRRVVKNLRAVLYELNVQQEEARKTAEALTSMQRQLQALRQKYVDLFDGVPVGYLTVDAAGIIREANLTIARMLELPREDLIGKQLVAHLAEESCQAFLQHVRLANESGETKAFMQMVNKGGDPFQVEFRSVPLSSDSGESFLRIAVIDVGEDELSGKSHRDQPRREVGSDIGGEDTGTEH
jgi:PAS domain S-box-containing protein